MQSHAEGSLRRCMTCTREGLNASHTMARHNSVSVIKNLTCRCPLCWLWGRWRRGRGSCSSKDTPSGASKTTTLSPDKQLLSIHCHVFYTLKYAGHVHALAVPVCSSSRRSSKGFVTLPSAFRRTGGGGGATGGTAAAFLGGAGGGEGGAASI